MFLEKAMISLKSSNRLIFLMEIQAASVCQELRYHVLCAEILFQEATLKVHVMFPHRM